MSRPSAVDVSVVTTAHDVADARLHRLVMVLTSHGLRVEVLGLGRPERGPVASDVRTWRRHGLVIRAAMAALAPWSIRGRVMMVLDPELVLPALVRRQVTHRNRSPRAGRWLVADVHEDYVLALQDRSWAHGPAAAVGAGVAHLSRLLAQRADLTLVADDHVPPLRARNRLVLPNLPLAELLPPPSTRDRQPRALYVGDVRRSRGLQTMMSALERSPDWLLDVVGPVALDDRAWLRAWQQQSPARDRVRFHGRRPPREAWSFASGAWVGLSLLTPTPAFTAAMPTKILEYLACGLAVLSSPLPRPTRLLQHSGAGLVTETPQQVSDVLQSWSTDPVPLDEHRDAARKWRAAAPAHHQEYEEFARSVHELARRR
jgi:glycosyltransferase involved in cell wall biosynthesis